MTVAAIAMEMCVTLNSSPLWWFCQALAFLGQFTSSANLLKSTRSGIATSKSKFHNTANEWREHNGGGLEVITDAWSGWCCVTLFVRLLWSAQRCLLVVVCVSDCICQSCTRSCLCVCVSWLWCWLHAGGCAVGKVNWVHNVLVTCRQLINNWHVHCARV